ncbi:aminoglycoside 6-adenylyltransferase [Lederbergia graminis]|uniref:Aminoglycoside 6-adenylyltransferase n=1 Tax=Lederbergia graminis TaxID=735518 RepID=A0ABW0LEC9_9BACI
MGLVSNHKERDLQIPKHRQRIKAAIEQDLIHDPNVLAIYYGGSIGNQNTDLFSDIDLRIVVKDECFEDYRLHKKQRARNWGNVLYFEDFPWTSYSIAHYDSFIKVDSFYYKITDIQPSIWLQNINIVHDSTGLVNDALEKSMKLMYKPTMEEVEIWRTKFFAYAHEVYRRVMRNELYYALHCLDNMRLSMVTAWYMDAGIQPNTFGDWAKLEGNRSKLSDSQLLLLEKWDSSRDPTQITHVMQSMFPEFKRVHKSLCEKLGIAENPEWVDRILRMVM